MLVCCELDVVLSSFCEISCLTFKCWWVNSVRLVCWLCTCGTQTDSFTVICWCQLWTRLYMIQNLNCISGRLQTLVIFLFFRRSPFLFVCRFCVCFNRKRHHYSNSKWRQKQYHASAFRASRLNKWNNVYEKKHFKSQFWRVVTAHCNHTLFIIFKIQFSTTTYYYIVKFAEERNSFFLFVFYL